MHVGLRKRCAEFPEVRASSDIFDLGFGGGVIRVEPARVVADQIDPTRTTIAAGSDQRAIVIRRRESDFQKRVWQIARVHIFEQAEKSFALDPSVGVWNREFEFLMKVIDRSVERLVALHHQIRSALEDRMPS
jgi:hypothetical protein